MRSLFILLFVTMVATPALANSTLMLRVTTPKGDPIPHATVAFEQEDYAPHTVNKSNGDLSVTYFKTATGKKQQLVADTEVRFTATAAGYLPSQQTVTLNVSRTSMRVTLRAIDLDLTDEPVQFSLSPHHVLGLSDAAQQSFENTVHAARWMIQQGPIYQREAMQWADLAIKRSVRDDPAPLPQDVSQAHRLNAIAATKAWALAATAERRTDERQIANFKTLAFRAAKRWQDYNIETMQNFSEARNLCIAAAPKPTDCDQ